MLSVNEIIECTKILSKNEPDTIWIPETWGMENFSMLTTVAQHTKSAKIGSSIINIFSRSPALISMGAVTVDTISNGRMILGLGTSSLPIIENFHGYKFENPVSRMKEYVTIIQKIISKEKIIHNGKFFKLSGFSLLVDPPRKKIPIYLAAVNKKMVKLSWEIADGVIFYLRPIDELKQTIKKMQSDRRIDVTCQLITCVSNDAQKAVNRAKKTLAFYVSVGEIYRKFLANNGFQNETKNIFEEFKKTGFKNCHEFITDKMLNSLTVYGTPDDCKKQLAKFVDAGLSMPIIQFNPIDNVRESFELVTKTFSE